MHRFKVQESCIREPESREFYSKVEADSTILYCALENFTVFGGFLILCVTPCRRDTPYYSR
jgi:hypothetical protein